MSEIYREFEAQIAGWHEECGEDVDREILRLYLLALEREENVVVAYHDRTLGRRLAAMRIPAAVRELMRDALAQVRADEQRHVLAARAALRRIARPMVGVRKFVHETAGAMGGWTASVRQHRRWSEAPCTRAAATLLLWAGRLARKVPDTVRPHLDYCSFRDFCRYNMETERTAWRCWGRLAELASHVPGISSRHVDDMRRVSDEEDRHRRVFATLAGALTADDRLEDGVTEEDVAHRLAAIAPHFLSPEWAEKTTAVSETVDAAHLDDAPEDRPVARCQVGG